MRFCPNLSILFDDSPFLDRFGRAAGAGFDTVEFWWPRGERLEDVGAAISEAGVSVALFNFDAGDMAAGDRGLLSDAERASGFCDNVPVALEFAQQVGAPRLNALVGLQREGVDREDQLSLAAENVGWAAEQAAPLGIEVMVEPVNTIENGPYLLPTTRAGADFISRVGRDNVKLQYDVYHSQRTEGNIVATLNEFRSLITHIQVADSPERGAPGTGEINYPFVFRAIEELGYGGYVGLEYKATTGTAEESFAWLPSDRRRDLAADELFPNP